MLHAKLPVRRSNLTGPYCKLMIACAAAAMTLPLLAHASTSVDEHRAAGAEGTVEINNVAGSIDVQGWDKSEVAVTGSIGKDVERVEVTGDGSHTSVRVILPHGQNWGVHDGEAHLVVHVPVNSSVHASLVSSDLKISSVRGGLELRTVSGNISGESGGDVRANTVNGDIRFKAPAAKVIEVKAISGHIDFTGGNADIEASTVSGDVRLSLGTVSRARFKSVSGEFSATLGAAADAQIDGESVSGDFKLDFTSAPDASYDIQALSGSIDNCFGPKPVEARYGPGSRLSFKTGEGGARVHVSTNSGEVRLCAKK
jgi:Putative adhesin